MKKTNGTKRISTNKTPGNMLSLKKTAVMTEIS